MMHPIGVKLGSEKRRYPEGGGLGWLSRGGLYETNWEAHSSRRGGGGWDEGMGPLGRPGQERRQGRGTRATHNTRRPLPYGYDAASEGTSQKTSLCKPHSRP